MRRIEEALANPEMRALFADYVQELADPKNRAEYEEYLRQLEANVSAARGRALA
jgi:hypothetical protein